MSVRDSQEVRAGDILATAPDQSDLPLLAPRAGTVRLTAVPGHIALEVARPAPVGTVVLDEEAIAATPPRDAVQDNRALLCRLGAWQCFRDVRTGDIPDPCHEPAALVIMVTAFDSFIAQPEALLAGKATDFVQGLKALHRLFSGSGCRIHVVVGEGECPTAVNEAIEAVALDPSRFALHRVPQLYPNDNPQLATQTLKLASPPQATVWAMGVEGVLAVAFALTLYQPYLERTISVGGPAVEKPRHVVAAVGHPIADLLAPLPSGCSFRIVNGGLMSGTDLAPQQQGLDGECPGLTVVHVPAAREFLGFVRPGRFRQSFSRCFLGTLFSPTPEPLTSLLGGEERACVACGHCEHVCPANLLPQVLHRYLYNDQMDDAQALGLDECVECGLCSYVCPCKIELREQFAVAKQQLRSDADDAALATAAASVTDQ